MGSAVKARPVRTFSSITTLSPPAPSPRPSAGVNSHTVAEVQDVYADARERLLQKVPGVVSQTELDTFLAVGSSSSCTTISHARDLLESIRSDGQYRGRFHKFFEAVHSLFEPLRLFKTALDTLCQVQSAFCLVWGSMKLLIEVSNTILL